VHVDADLRLTREGSVFDVWTEDGNLVVNAPSFRAAVAAARTLPPGLADAVGALADRELTVELRVRHATVAVFRPEAGRSRLLAGLPGRLRTRGVLGAAARWLG